MKDKYWGKYRAQVLDVNDPLKRGRIKVKSEHLMPDEKSLGWAESCMPPYQFNLPSVDDFVWIEFEQGDINLPIWVGIMPTRKYVKEKLFRGRYGDRIHYDPYVRIFTSENHELLTVEDNDLLGKISIKFLDKAGSGFTFATVDGDLSIGAKNEVNGKHKSEEYMGNGSGSSGGISPGSPKSVIPMGVEPY